MPLLRLKSGSLAQITVVLLGTCAVVQVALGANVVVSALAIIACLLGLAGFRIAGAYNAAGWLALFFVLGNTIVAIVAKTILLQPLNSNLYAPLESFTVLATGSTVLLIALLIALVIPLGKPLFSSVSEVRSLRSLSNWTLVLGALFWYLNRLAQDPEGSGFGGVAVFWNLVLMGVIARTAMLVEQSDGRRSLDTALLLIIAACIVMGLLDNSKAEVALPVVAYFATSLFYRGGLTLRQVGAAALGLLLMATLIGPMIHAFRELGIQAMPWQERMSLIERGVKDALTRGDLQPYQELASGQFLYGYYNYFGEGTRQMLLGRYASIQEIDPVIASVNRHGTVGGRVIWPSFERLLPSFVDRDKPRYIEGYQLLVHLGIIDPRGGKYPTVPLLAQSYAGYGVIGLVLVPLFTFLGFLLVLKKLGWNLHRNVFAIFFFCVFIVVYSNQGDVGQYAHGALRTFPLLAAVLWLVNRMSRPHTRLNTLPPTPGVGIA